MIKVRFDGKKSEKKEKTYRVIDIAKACGISEGRVHAYFSNRNVSVRGGNPRPDC